MPQDSFEFRIAYKKLLIGLLVTVVPISLAALYAISESASSMERAISSHYTAIADSIGAQVAQFIQSKVMHVGLMATNPAVVEAVEAANRSYEGMSEEAINAKIERVESIWTTPQADSLVKEILSSTASRSLRRYVQLDPTLLRITVTDEKGATVSATHKTIDYYQADEQYWRNIYAEGRGSISLTDIEYDVVTKHSYIGIGAPITDEETGRVLGTLDALVEVSSLSPLVGRANAGAGVRTLLVREDGAIIASPRATLAANLKSEEYEAVLDSVDSIKGRETGYVVANFGDRGDTLIAFADTGLKQDFQAPGWVVLVSQPTELAFAPIWKSQRLIMLISFLGLAAVVVLGVYFSLHRKGEVEEIEEEFHPKYPSKATSA